MNRLKISIILISIIVIVSFLAPIIAPYEKEFQENIITKVIEGESVRFYSPHTPDLKHLLGTNVWGYDVLTIVLYGMKYTLIVAFTGALLRVFLGLLIGLPLGFYPTNGLKSFNGLNSVPAFILAYFILFRISMASSLNWVTLLIIQLIVISILGVPNTVSTIKNNTALVLKEGFVTAAYSCGASNLRIIFKHIIPNIRERILILFVSEMTAVLNVIGQLGIFNIFIGGTKLSKDPVLYYSVTNELAGLIGQGRNYIDFGQWILLAPLFAYILLLSLFHFLQVSLEQSY